MGKTSPCRQRTPVTIWSPSVRLWTTFTSKESILLLGDRVTPCDNFAGAFGGAGVGGDGESDEIEVLTGGQGAVGGAGAVGCAGVGGAGAVSGVSLAKDASAAKGDSITKGKRPLPPQLATALGEAKIMADNLKH